MPPPDGSLAKFGGLKTKRRQITARSSFSLPKRTILGVCENQTIAVHAKTYREPSEKQKSRFKWGRFPPALLGIHVVAAFA